MPEIGVRELKTRASEIVRSVRERHARYVVTYRGSAVGVLTPLEDTPDRTQQGAAGSSSAWDELIKLGEEIAASWSCEESGAEILSGMRR